MKKVSIYKPTSIDEAMQMLTKHGQEAGVYAGGTDLLIRLKNRLTQAPTRRGASSRNGRGAPYEAQAGSCRAGGLGGRHRVGAAGGEPLLRVQRSEEHTSE